MKKLFLYSFVILFLIGASVLATYPLIKVMGTSVKNLGDPVFNIWILQWDINKMLTGMHNFFDANIFYPHKNTLAYSEHLIPQALIGLPVYLKTGQPIFTYNFLFLFTFVFSGFGMFLLLEHLTKNTLAAFLGGIAFAFCPFRFGHLAHLQILSTEWIPFTFLFFHKFMEKYRIRHLVFFSCFFILQVLSCSYYGFFLSLSLLIMAVVFLINKKLNFKKVYSLIATGLLIAIFLFPFFYPYYRFKKEMNFKRPLSEVELYSAQPHNYLAAPPDNRLLGKLTERFVDSEGQLFTGLTVFLLAIMGVFKISQRNRSCSSQRSKFLINRILEVLTVSMLLFIIYLYRGGGFDFNVSSFNASFHSIRNPFYLLIFLIVLRWLNSFDKKKFLVLDYRVNAYLVLTVSSFILSLGPFLIIADRNTGVKLPYLFLYNHIPGFEGLRVPSRWACFTAFSLIVLAGFGLKRFFDSFKENRAKFKWAGVMAVSAFLIAESIYVPIDYKRLLRDIPPVYQWLADKKEKFAVIELPMPIDGSREHYEAMYMYWSIYHWKSLVNGYSGFFPPDYWPINKAMRNFPDTKSVKMLQRVGIKYVIVHSARMEEEKVRQIKEGLKGFSECLKLKNKLQGDYVIEIFPLDERKGER